MMLIEQHTLIEKTRSDISCKHDVAGIMFLVINAIMAGA